MLYIIDDETHGEIAALSTSVYCLAPVEIGDRVNLYPKVIDSGRRFCKMEVVALAGGKRVAQASSRACSISHRDRDSPLAEWSVGCLRASADGVDRRGV
ncbi:hypothetical protein [Paenibacillus mendelii]|uniref:Uncharacterized protein n=1 Tax=Paenibacillus mendelii TaxID=206163 RepID=A0ABV6J4L1_9BACL|nr:hypothetical protein [Paenibacillus mendelii]MCQ6560480.1 hypothetical protein [Paenibacillus mendelii]